MASEPVGLVDVNVKIAVLGGKVVAVSGRKLAYHARLCVEYPDLCVGELFAVIQSYLPPEYDRIMAGVLVFFSGQGRYDFRHPQGRSCSEHEYNGYDV